MPTHLPGNFPTDGTPRGLSLWGGRNTCARPVGGQNTFDSKLMEMESFD